jgi:hypothetical protein
LESDLKKENGFQMETSDGESNEHKKNLSDQRNSKNYGKPGPLSF